MHSESVRVDFPSDAYQITSLNLAHHDAAVGAGLSDDVDDLADYFGTDLGFREHATIAHCVLNEGTGVHDTASTAIEHLEL